jgi:hypothetical protein
MLVAYEQLKALILSIEDDVRKAAGGNRAAGTRVRKHMQEIKNKAQELRVKVLEGRDSEGAEGSESASEAGQTPSA